MGPSHSEHPPASAPDEQAATTGRRASWPARLYVLGYVAVFAVCGTFAIEAWPFTSWKLFSGVRPATARGWLVTNVDPQGREYAVGVQGFAQQLMISFRKHGPERQRSICAGWVALGRKQGHEVRSVHIYRSSTNLRLHKGHRDPPPPLRQLYFTCTPTGDVTPITPPRTSDVVLS